jgi:hypothetical protein
MNGTCPLASHVYSFNVRADYSSNLKDFWKFTSGAFRNTAPTPRSLSGRTRTPCRTCPQYKDALIVDVQLFHCAATVLPQAYDGSGISAYTSVLGYGTRQLASASAQFGDVPNKFFAFG